MELNEYQAQRQEFAVYKKHTNGGDIEGLTYSILALCGESGELANKLKKNLRVHRPYADIDKLVLADELGDCLWYVGAVADELNMSLEEVAQMNIEKLKARKAADKITG